MLGANAPASRRLAQSAHRRVVPRPKMLVRALSASAFCALATCSSGRVVAAPAAAGPLPCTIARVDTTGWVLTRNHALGVEFLRPPAYVQKVWDSRRGMGNVVDWWRDDRPDWTFDIAVVDSLTGRRGSESLRELAVSGQLKDVRRCSLASRAGVADVLLYRSGNVPHQLAIMWTADEGRVIRFGASSADSAGRNEQLAIARTMRVIAQPR